MPTPTATAANPPTTPPAMAPTFEDDVVLVGGLEGTGDVEVGVGVAVTVAMRGLVIGVVIVSDLVMNSEAAV